MKQFNLTLLFCLFSLLCMGQSKQQLELREVTNGVFNPKNIYGVIPVPGEGEFYTQMNREGTQIIKYSFKTGKQVEVLFDASTARECPFKHFDSYQFAPDGSKLLIATNTHPIYRRSYTAEHYIYSLKRNLEGKINNKVERLSDGGAQQVPLFSPDGTMVAFVRDNNIFLVKLLYGNSESQITTDGARNAIINGIPDWVYEEEFSFNRAFEFSADSKMLAYIRFDEREVPSYSFPLYQGQCPRLKQYSEYPGQYTYKYPKTGEPNSKVSVHTFDIKTRVTRKMDVPMDNDGYIPRIRFTKDPDKLAIITMNRHQDRMDVFLANPRSTVCKLIVRDQSDKYINEDVLDNIIFYDDHFSLMSDRSGYAHIYWYRMNGTLDKQITKGNYVVNQFLGYVPSEGAFYYISNEESPLKKALYKIDRKGKKIKLSNHSGTNSVQFSSDMSYYMNRYTSVNTPLVITLNDRNGKVLTTLEDNRQLTELLARYELPHKEFFTFKNPEGISLNGWMMKPTHFDPTKKYPVLMFQYSGPGSQQVLDKYTFTWENYMATQGYVVVCVDGRGTGGRGAAFEKCTYLELGVKESQDQVAAAKYVGTLPFVDASRIGIWGWSYGGYTTLMSLSEGTPVFKAGVAVAAVTDWKYYDTIYGERYMRTPKENPEGYAKSSAFTRAGNMNSALLLVHGTADDNVQFQNCTEYSEQLVQQNKQFQMQVYTNRNHGIYGCNTRFHLYTRLTDFFNQNMK